MGEHGALGRAGGARGVAEQAHVLGTPPVHLGVPGIGLAPRRRPPRLEHLPEPEEPRLGVPREPLGVVVDDALEPREPPHEVEELVDLLLVLHDHGAGAGMLQHVADLFGQAVLIDADGDAAQ